MFYKKIACGFSLIVALSFQNISALTDQKKQGTIILWDIHDVILERDVEKIFSILWHDKNTWKTVSHTNSRFFGGSIKLLWKFITNQAASEQFVQLAKKENNQPFIEFLKAICNAQKPIEETVAIIKELCANGYTHHIGSNIGKTVFDDLINPNLYPQFADLFACFDLEKSHVISCAENGSIIRKPRIQYFQEYLKKNNINLNTTRVIFIDDRTENIVTAKKIGLHGIHFKNPKQLRTDLRELGLELSPQQPESEKVPSTDEMLLHEGRRI